MKISIPASTSTTRMTRTVHLKIDLIFIRLNGIETFEQEPDTHDQFEHRHGKIEPPVINDLVEVGENQVDERAEDAPGRTDHSEDRQSARDVFRFEPKPGDRKSTR